jgi:hypothetical protein
MKGLLFSKLRGQTLFFFLKKDNVSSRFLDSIHCCSGKTDVYIFLSKNLFLIYLLFKTPKKYLRNLVKQLMD